MSVGVNEVVSACILCLIVRGHALSAMLLRVYLAGHCSDTLMGVNRFDMTNILCPIIISYILTSQKEDDFIPAEVVV